MKKILLLLVIIIALFTGGLGCYLMGLGPVDPSNDEEVNVQIPEGSGASYIVDILDEAGLVKNRTCARINARIGGYDTLQANSYVFMPSMTFKEIMTAINKGDFEYVSKKSFVLKDGATIPMAAEALAQVIPESSEEILALWNDREFVRSQIDKYWFLDDVVLDKDIMYPFEGYFFPDTYFLTDQNSSLEEITGMMLDSMDKVLTARKSEIEASGFSVHEFLTLASVVTSEGGTVDSEAPTIAGVFINRLKNGTPLQSDVTVNYALQQKRVDVSITDTETDSKYNTYKHKGLPIGPICAVPELDMNAVLNYEKTDYLFFYATPEGEVLYGKTGEEHQKNIEAHPWLEEDLKQ